MILLFLLRFLVHAAPSVHLVTFADGEPYQSTQELLDATHIQPGGFTTHLKIKGRNTLITNIERGVYGRDIIGKVLKLNPESWRRGGFWKPLLVLHVLKSLHSPDDYVLFHDCSQYIREGFLLDVKLLVQWLDDVEVLGGVRMKTSFHYEYTQECVDYRLEPRLPLNLNLLRELCEYLKLDYHGVLESAIVQNSFSIWRNSPSSIRVVEEW